jgi:hypothetical protein
VKTSSVMTSLRGNATWNPCILNESRSAISSSPSLDLIAISAIRDPFSPSLLHNQQISQLNSFCHECACSKFVCNLVDSDEPTVSFI